MKKVLITGSKGVVGRILIKELSSDYEITGYDIPENDVSDLEMLRKSLDNFDCIIHLAMDSKVGFRNELFNPDDLTMVYNLYQVAKENKIPRVIMFSSIHADEYDLSSKELHRVNKLPSPDSPYGAYKVCMEALGRYYAKKGLEVICIRLGGVTSDDNFELDEAGFQQVYLSHKDLVAMIKCYIEIKYVHNNYELFYAISNNPKKVHDNSNNIGWRPI